MSYTTEQMRKAFDDLEGQHEFMTRKQFTGESSYESDFGALHAYVKLLRRALHSACDVPVVMAMSAKLPVRLVDQQAVIAACEEALRVEGGQ